MEQKNKRGHFRVDILIPVKWEVLDKEESETVKNGLGNTLFKQHGVPSPIEEYLENTVPGSKDEQFYLALQFLNNKMDFIIEQLMDRSMGKNLFQDSITELSAEGLKFRTREKIEPGMYIKMNLMMPGVIQFGMELIVEVLRVVEDKDEYITAGRIACIMDDARDSIVKLIFRKQRSDIRNHKQRLEEIE